MQWKRQKMKVKLTAQVISNSINDALLCLARNDNQFKFKGCEMTAEFL